ncbi:hypothetical protein FPQ18DRAFT_387389 [Pyronema domesticum]|nr:hypothetical protein FPQ18DRAFT_387389 [Pyronema domesticum]
MAEVIGTDLSPIQSIGYPVIDDVMKNWTFTDDFFDFIHGRNISADPHPTHEFWKNVLEKVEFEDVQMHVSKERFGPWPKDPRLKSIGAMNLLNGETGFESYGMAAFTRILGMSADEARGICQRGLAACQNKNYHVQRVNASPWQEAIEQIIFVVIILAGEVFGLCS